MGTDTSFPRVAVLGAGSWGTALAALACAQSDTLLWARDPAVVQAINDTTRHPRHLTDIDLPPSLQATSSLDDALAHVCAPSDCPGLIILGVPVSGLDDICLKLQIYLQDRPRATDLAVVWTCKGFQPDTGQLPHEIASRRLAGLRGIGLGVLSGPSFANEVARGFPVALTLASDQAWVAAAGTAALHGPNARIYSSTDIIGVEVGGAMKNIMAIACGISDGLGLGDNARAALITRGLAEIQRLGLALGGQPETFAGLTGMGDLVLTATGALSRNRQVGLAIAQGQSLEQVLATGMTAEGVRCARAALALGRSKGVELPVTDAVCQVLFHGLAPSQAVKTLLSRDSRPESGDSR